MKVRRNNARILAAAIVSMLLIALGTNTAFAEGLSPAHSSEITSVKESDQAPPYPQFTPKDPPADYQTASCRATGRLILCGDGEQRYDHALYALISRAFTRSYANYKSVEIWVWWWNGSRWVLIDQRKAETRTGITIDVVSRMGNEWIPTGGSQPDGIQ